MSWSIENFRGHTIHGQGNLFRWMSIARAFAAKSHHAIPVGAVLTYRGRFLSGGCNNAHRTHPEAKNATRVLHAEADAIVGLDRRRFVGATCWVYRERKDGTVGMAKPCATCHNFLAVLGVKVAIYTDPSCGFALLRLG